MRGTHFRGVLEAVPDGVVEVRDTEAGVSEVGVGTMLRFAVPYAEPVS